MLEEFRAHRNLAKLALQFAQVSQQRNYNQDHLNFELEVGDSVLINLHSLNLLCANTGLGKRLLNKFDGPFKVTQKLGPATYQIWMPASYGIHPVLNIAHLEPYHQSGLELGPRPTKPLGRLGFKDLPEYDVERILQDCWRKAKNRRHVPEFLVRFVGYDATYDEWLTRKQLKNAPEVL